MIDELKNVVKRMLGRRPTPLRYKHLFQEISRLKATKIMEVGTWNGRRAVQMIECAAHFNPVANIEYVGFDLFEGLTEELYKEEISKRPPAKAEVAEKLEATGAIITLVEGNTLETLPEFSKGSFSPDFVFIDGGHKVETIQSDWDAVAGLLHSGSVVIFDDYWPERADFGGCKHVVDAIDTTQYDVEILPTTDVFDNQDFGHLVIQFAKVVKK